MDKNTIKGMSDLELVKLAHELKRYPEDKPEWLEAMDEIKRRDLDHVQR